MEKRLLWEVCYRYVIDKGEPAIIAHIFANWIVDTAPACFDLDRNADFAPVFDRFMRIPAWDPYDYYPSWA
jgi:hypothetical protein